MCMCVYIHDNVREFLRVFVFVQLFWIDVMCACVCVRLTCNIIDKYVHVLI